MANTIVFDRAAARAAKADGMGRAERGASPSWRTMMLIFTKQVAERQKFFTSDDVFRLAYDAGVANNTPDLRAFGPIMLNAQRAGICRKAYLPPVNSARRTLHASPRSVWESLIYGKPVLSNG